MGVSGVIVLGAILKKQKDEKRKEQVKEQIRDYFNQLGEISVLYLNDFESDSQKTTGGVFEDGRTFQFVYQNGEISYEERKMISPKSYEEMATYLENDGKVVFFYSKLVPRLPIYLSCYA